MKDVPIKDVLYAFYNKEQIYAIVQEQQYGRKHDLLHSKVLGSIVHVHVQVKWFDPMLNYAYFQTN